MTECELKKINNREYQIIQNGKLLKCKCGRDIMAILENDNYTRNCPPCGKVEIDKGTKKC